VGATLSRQPQSVRDRLLILGATALLFASLVHEDASAQTHTCRRDRDGRGSRCCYRTPCYRTPCYRRCRPCRYRRPWPSLGRRPRLGRSPRCLGRLAARMASGLSNRGRPRPRRSRSLGLLQLLQQLRSLGRLAVGERLLSALLRILWIRVVSVTGREHPPRSVPARAVRKANPPAARNVF
jgi:hypothetical protein